MSAHVLVINSGSSSIKYQLLDLPEGKVAAEGIVERIGEPRARLSHTGPAGHLEFDEVVPDHETGMALVVRAFAESGPDLAQLDLAAVGHRVVHGGEEFSAPTLITPKVCEVIDRLSALAPLHNPANLTGIRVATALFPQVPHVAVFDTAFHANLPEIAYHYAVPREWRTDHGVRRYGFHGTSHAFVSQRTAELLGAASAQVNVIVLHLGNGASAAAVRGGVSVDTSMGLTPLEGLVMGTRSGDIDPALVFHMHAAGMSTEQIEDALNRHSGLLGLCGDNDMREVTRRIGQGDQVAQLARDVYCYRVRKYIGSYLAVLGRVDAIAFTAGVGQNSPQVRASVLTGMSGLGIELDADRNARNETRISTADSPVAVFVVPTNEELEIARQSLALVSAHP